MNYIYRIFTLQAWETADKTQALGSPSLATEGFIHLCTEAQLQGVLSRYFSGETKVIAAKIDTNKLIAPLRYEVATGGDLFPHLYGLLNVEAIVSVEEKVILK
jgi:uncharacterized protein (DUF952 family)